MPKGKTRGGPRKARRLTDLTSDVEMVEAYLPRSERVKPRGKNRPGFQAKKENDRRSRMGKAAAPAQSNTGSVRGSQAAKGPGTTGRNLRSHTAARPSPSPFVPPRSANRNRQLSALSAMSTALSAQPGPWCGKCNQLNRQLRGYLLDILKTGEQAVDEWACAVGASPDHMECEPAPERIIPEGYRRCSQQCQSCVARRLEGEAGAATPPELSSWSGSPTAAAPGGYLSRYEMFNEEQMGRGGLHAHAGPGLTLTLPNSGLTSSPPHSSLQVNQGLVAIPEDRNLLHAHWAGSSHAHIPPPAQQLHRPMLPHPWDGGARDQTNADPGTPAARHWYHPGSGAHAAPPGHVVLPPILEHNAAAALPPTPPPRELSDDGGRPRGVDASPASLSAFPAATRTGAGGSVDGAPRW